MSRWPAVALAPFWESFVSDPVQWWDKRSTKERLRPGNDVSIRISSSKSVFDNGDKDELLRSQCQPCRVAGYEEDLQVRSWSESCAEGPLLEAVEELDRLVQRGSHVDSSVLYGVLKDCIAEKDLVLGSRIHGLAVQSGYESNAFLAKHIISMYASHKRLEEAWQVFAKVSAPSLSVWAAIILAHARHGQPTEAIMLYQRMRQSSIQPNENLFVAVLKACANMKDLSSGRAVHSDILHIPGQPNVVIGTCLVDMYSKCGCLEDARRVFNNMPTKDVVLWNAMITGYAQHGLGQEALTVYASMQHEGVTDPNHVTFVCLLRACASVGALHQGKQLHSQIQERQLGADVVIGTSLVDMYSKCKRLEDGRRVFDNMQQKTVVTWNAMITGYAQEGLGEEALALYESMRRESIRLPNHVTFVCLLQACASIGALQQGQQLHTQIQERGLDSDVVVATCLVDMYAKCNSLEDAQTVFDKMSSRDVVTWNAIIGGYAQNGLGQEALTLYARMQREGFTPPNCRTYVCLLQACASVRALQEGQQLHVEVQEKRLGGDVSVGNSLINMYAKCGSLEDARRVFDNLPTKDVATWNTMITAYAQNGRGQESLTLYGSMRVEDIVAADGVTFVCLLQACASTGALHQGKQLHAQIQDRGMESDAVVGHSLVNMYAKCGSFEDAWNVFDKLTTKDVVTWNAMIAGYALHGRGQEALTLHERMQQGSITLADSATFVCLLQACASVGNLQQGRQLHAEIRQRGLEADAVVGTSLVHMYTKCGSLGDARRVLDNLPSRTVVTWNSMISGYTQNGLGQEALSLYTSMEKEGIVSPDAVTFVSLLQACGSIGALKVGQHLDARIQGGGLQTNVVVSNSVIDMYAKCGSLVDARRVFDNAPTRDVVTWNTMISGYVLHGLGHEAMTLYGCMQLEGITPADAATFVSLLQACASFGGLHQGKDLHVQIQERGLESDVVVGTCLVDMYAKCGSFEDARRVFDNLPIKNVVSWNAMIGACAERGLGQEAFSLYERMQQEGAVPADAITYVGLLQACASLRQGKQLHAQIRERGLEADTIMGNCLIKMYAKCGSVEDARRLFDNMPTRDVMTWNAMLGGYCQHGRVQEALVLYGNMQEEGTTPPDSVTFVCLLQACADVAGLEKGKEIHASIRKHGLEATDFGVASSLMDMYAKCGSMNDARQVFEALPRRDIVVWNPLIAGYARQGESEPVFHLFDRMRQEGTRPNAVTFLSLLTVCSHVGLVDKGQKFFQAMSTDYNITPSIEHYNCMVDLLGRAGMLEEAMGVVTTMPCQPDSAVWRSVLGACRKWNNVEVGRQAFECAVRLDKNDVAAYVLMSNIYRAANMPNEGKQIQTMSLQARAWKKPGQTCWSDASGRLHTFLVGDRKHPWIDALPGEVEEEMTEATIRVLNTQLVCKDCHPATALMSKTEQRTIICRNPSRFRHKDGTCSCGGYQ